MSKRLKIKLPQKEVFSIKGAGNGEYIIEIEDLDTLEEKEEACSGCDYLTHFDDMLRVYVPKSLRREAGIEISDTLRLSVFGGKITIEKEV